MLCNPGDVAIGIRGYVSQDSLYGIAVDCGRLEIRPNGTSEMLDIVATRSPAIIGGYPDQTAQTKFALPCPPSSIVTAVSGATLPPWGDARICVKELTLSCSPVKVDSTRKLVIGASPTMISAGKQDDTSTAFPADTCGPGGAVTGFTGNNGNLLDAVAIQCGTVS